MLPTRLFKTIAVSLCALVPALEASAAVAPAPFGIMATFDITGDWEFSSPSGGPNVFTIDGEFEGELINFDPNLTSAYHLSAALEISDDTNGVLLSESGSFDTPVINPAQLYSDLLNLIAVDTELQNLVGAVIGGITQAGTPAGLTIPFSATDFLFFKWELDSLTSTTLDGTFDIAFTTNATFSDVNLPIFGNILPDNETGSFALSTSVQPVPVPPALPLLGAGMLGLWGFRRLRS